MHTAADTVVIIVECRYRGTPVSLARLVDSAGARCTVQLVIANCGVVITPVRLLQVNGVVAVNCATALWSVAAVLFFWAGTCLGGELHKAKSINQEHTSLVSIISHHIRKHTPNTHTHICRAVATASSQVFFSVSLRLSDLVQRIGKRALSALSCYCPAAVPEVR